MILSRLKLPSKRRKNFTNLALALITFILIVSCTKETGIAEKRCTNRLCCQRAAQKKQARHTHKDIFLTLKKPETTKKEPETKEQKEVRQPKF